MLPGPSLNGAAYTSAEIFAEEERAIFRTHWICVGRDDEVALPGQWLRETIASAPVLVVRGADLELRAFHDVCRHRGASLVGRKDCGRSARLVCPYHGWTYELDGRGKEASLLAVGCATWAGFVFVNLAGGTLETHDAPPWLAGLGPLVRARRTVAMVRASWKLLAQNFQESHHFPGIHPALEALTPTAEARTWTNEGRWLGGMMAIRGETVSRDGKRHGRPRITDRDDVHDALFFPLLLTSLQPDYLLSYRLYPESADTTRIVADIHVHPAGAAHDWTPVFEFWDQVNAEDRAICEDQQANARSPGFQLVGYTSVEEGVAAFDRLVTRSTLPR